MQKFIIDTFVAAVEECFDMMMGCEVTAGDPYVVKAASCEQDINAMIGLSGGLPGNVIVGVDRQLAIEFTENVIGHSTDTIDEQVIDAMGEIANMIVGGAKCNLSQYKLSMSLPTVICGKGLTINFPSGVRPALIPFKVGESELRLCIGLCDDAALTDSGLPEVASEAGKGPILAFNQSHA